MNIERIKKTALTYNEALNEIKKNREAWRLITKPLLINTLREITNSIQLDWHSHILEVAINSEGVNIQLNSTPSGIFQKTERGSRAFVKKGGVITFSQAYNGQIFVIIIYPNVEEFVGESEVNVLGRYKPEDITEEFIFAKVEKFLEEMTKWETSISSNRIGF